MDRRWIQGVVLGLVLVAGVLGAFQARIEAEEPLPPIDCSIVLCPAPDCLPGTKPVILPGDCCFTCVPIE